MFWRLLLSDPKLQYLSFGAFCCSHLLSWHPLSLSEFLKVNKLQGLNTSLQCAPTLALLTRSHWWCTVNKAFLSIFAHVMQKDLDTHSAGCGRLRSSKGLILSRWTRWTDIMLQTKHTRLTTKTPFLIKSQPFLPFSRGFCTENLHPVKRIFSFTSTSRFPPLVQELFHFASASQHLHNILTPSFSDTKTWGVFALKNS